ncbi:MAG: Na+/H+ antiporter NhaC [Flavobacteriaceae bacterium]|nr:Na+/H+ antiporter NhaC [Flavobacteriaceae bacterium]MBT4313501.1 Na+/H+ antiporter NhaC [Flavobacteriaceae bacterium]MBT5090954.1 Na+/H+ antiporter NhaC [Flavobacteriaceae bacterium]MBT5283638.1 Na+/H+ antiporter NhaC [Flavobacteriaceae bacterium]MBT5446977.1 Na+/H+ antiporter NhaC [Flavobacteriaceae bacterium]
MKKKELSLGIALLPIVILVLLLSYNVLVYGDDALGGSNQFILLLGAAVAGIVGFYYKIGYQKMIDKVAENLQSVTGALLILLFVGALAGTWLISGIIPAMIYYGLQILHPSIFLPACIIICAIISLATGSSWTTSATVGIALIGIGKVLGIPVGMVAGAVISGAYFGDKLSPLSDTTNLAPAMAGGELFSHIKYMTLTTIPSIIITLVVFFILSLTQSTSGAADTETLMLAIEEKFTITPWLFIVPGTVILLIIKKSPPLIALLIGTLLGGLFAVVFQSKILLEITESSILSFEVAYRAIMNSITISTEINTSNTLLNDLFTSGGMEGMLGTIWLIICAMVFGGIMDAIGALERVSNALLNWAQTTFQLFASTVASCLAINLTASDQYLAIVIPGKMFAKAYKDRKLAPENLSRTLEDSGTVTSVLIPWNTCGAYQSGVLGVDVGDYFVYAIFNWLSPFMTLLFAAFNIKIKALKTT